MANRAYEMNSVNEDFGAFSVVADGTVPREYVSNYWIGKSCEEAQQWASDRLFGIGIDSAVRAFALYNLLSNVWMPESYKWAIFQATWPSCDNIESDLIAQFEDCFSGGSLGWEHLTGEDLAFYTSLPDEIPVFRGSNPARKFGWSWTTDKTVAASFAKGHRGMAVPEATIYSAVVQKTHVWSVFTVRGESEILSPPWSVDRIRVYRRLG